MSIEKLSNYGIKPEQLVNLQQTLALVHIYELLEYYPVRYLDRRKIHTLDTLPKAKRFVQLRGTITDVKLYPGKKKQLVAQFQDTKGSITLRWFHRLAWHQKKLRPQVCYLIWGELTAYAKAWQMIHPAMEIDTKNKAHASFIIHPVYPIPKKKSAPLLTHHLITRLQRLLLNQPDALRETLPSYVCQKYQLISRALALRHIHFPANATYFRQARLRLKFEELFYLQLYLLAPSKRLITSNKGYVFTSIALLKKFHKYSLPFPLTEAQQRVFKEMYQDFKSGRPMHRLLQGDVGSGKTMVACLGMLVCVDNQAQVALMVPTEILAQQHYQNLKALLDPLGVSIAVLTGSTPMKIKKEILYHLKSGQLQVVVGTHALLSDHVVFDRLGLVVIDEQHKFGVAQRAHLGKHQQPYTPHILVMTATPIPRTLAMTLYSNLSISVIDQMPVGRKPIKTFHYEDAQRLAIFHFIRVQLQAGHQVYIVYPFIDASQDQDHKDLMDGYESVSRAFPDYRLSIVHGRMQAKDKAYEMQRFVRGETQIMVATTVIEVGVNVPQATVMVIEQAERFGLAQLHQLRGRVGRGSLQSYCLLVTSNRLGTPGRTRMKTMLHTVDGFKIAEVDLKLRGPGDFLGVRQSGILTLKMANIVTDQKILVTARHAVREILAEDPLLEKEKYQSIRKRMAYLSHRYSD